MEQSLSGNRFTQALVSLAALVVVLAGMSAAREIIVPFLLAVFIAILLSGPLFWMRARGLPMWLALLIMVLVVLLLQFALAGLIGSSVNSFVKNLPTYEARLTQQTNQVIQWLEGIGLEMDETFMSQILNTSSVMRLTASIFNGLGNAFTNIVIILLLVIFMLLEASSLPGKLARKTGIQIESGNRLQEMVDNVKNYMAIKTVISLATGLLVFLLLTILGVDFPILWGVLAFALNYIPNIGSIIAAVPAVLLAFIQYDFLRSGLAAAGFVVINFVMGSVIEPRFMGRGLGLSTLVVFVSLLFWGWLLGPVGMLLSVPLSIAVKIILDSNEETRWLAVLLGPELPAGSPAEAEPATDGTGADT
jgi:predicted PurR-regulated permease PerM